MSKRRFTQGAVIHDPAQVVELLLRGQWLYWHNKPQHPQWLLSMQARGLFWAARNGILRVAVEVKA